jgi:hypothetical protein
MKMMGWFSMTSVMSFVLMDAVGVKQEEKFSGNG